ncbi:MAG: hypothetical protein V4534_03140 [Myxococcota bacterium]
MKYKFLIVLMMLSADLLLAVDPPKSPHSDDSDYQPTNDSSNDNSDDDRRSPARAPINLADYVGDATSPRFRLVSIFDTPTTGTPRPGDLRPVLTPGANAFTLEPVLPLPTDFPGAVYIYTDQPLPRDIPTVVFDSDNPVDDDGLRAVARMYRQQFATHGVSNYYVGRVSSGTDGERRVADRNREHIRAAENGDGSRFHAWLGDREAYLSILLSGLEGDDLKAAESMLICYLGGNKGSNLNSIGGRSRRYVTGCGDSIKKSTPRGPDRDPDSGASFRKATAAVSICSSGKKSARVH